MGHGNYQGNPSNLPISSTKEEIMMWQQNSFVHDSGINTPSIISGKDGDEEMDIFDLDQGYTPVFPQDQNEGTIFFNENRFWVDFY